MLPSGFSQGYRLTHVSNAFAGRASTCRCGRVLPTLEPTIQRRRRSVGKAPSTSRKERATRSPYTPAGIKRHAAQEQRREEARERGWTDLNAAVFAHFAALSAKGSLSVTAEEAMNLSVEFMQYQQALSRVSQTGRTAPASSSRGQADVKAQPPEHNVSDIDVATIAFSLMTHQDIPLAQQLGDAMMFHYSYAGNEYATLWLLGRAYDRRRDLPGEVYKPVYNESRRHLFEIANKGDNKTAMVLAGQIAYLSDQKDYAIRLWTDALEVSDKFEGPFKIRSEAFLRLIEQTSSPYVDLADAYLSRGHYKKAEYAIKIGCGQDHPTSHYYAARDNEAMHTDEVKDNKGNVVSWTHSPTSDWLYHMCKSAASGHPTAMHKLGCYYMRTYWPYLKDEVPDSVKPTPFDQYPPGSGSKTVVSESVWKRVRGAVGLGAMTLAKESSHNIFQSAATPNNVKGRLTMALAWFEAAQGLNYLPSFLAAARLYLLKNVYEDLAAPKAAVRLTNERYSFANKAAYDARKVDDDPDVEEIPNPLYDGSKKEDNKAHGLIQEVFSAAKAADARKQYVNASKNKKILHSFNAVRRDMPYRMSKWFLYPDYYPLWMNEEDGGLFEERSVTSKQDMDLLAEAKWICDQQGWEVFDPDDLSLMYRPTKSGR